MQQAYWAGQRVHTRPLGQSQARLARPEPVAVAPKDAAQVLPEGGKKTSGTAALLAGEQGDAWSSRALEVADTGAVSALC